MKNSEPFFQCPRYKKCSVNNCPLNTSYPEGFVHGDDAEKQCTLSKAKRVAIAAKFPNVLKFGGMKQREFTAQKKWDNLSDEEKLQIQTRLKKIGLTRRSQNDVLDLVRLDLVNEISQENT